MQQDANQDATRTPLERLTVAKAAARMGVSQDAVRKRIQRGTIRWDKDGEGRMYVWLDPSETSQAADQDATKTALQLMQEQVDYLKAVIQTRDEELRRKDHIIAALTQRIPELPPASPQEATDGPETVSEGAARVTYPRSMRRTLSAPGGGRYEMYAAIRRYQIDPDATPVVIEHILENFVPLIRQTPGLHTYHVIDGDNGAFATLTVCENQAAIETTNTMAAEWLRQYLAAKILSEQGTPNFSIRGAEIFQGNLYEGVSEPIHKQSLQLLSVQEVGELLGMGRSWVYNRIRSGELPSVQLGGTIKVKREDLEQYIQSHHRRSSSFWAGEE